ncbi:VOC family protein [Yinghuangia sp. ASG 101]|uniref:VOC family protein n=1 Tax=Yinghuangia sp. ASG 101 TaxID=2896848 RepID=UPI001E5EE046|nr:VOC family protein [Yinghuangia sp. ASG 101]UGQ12938.1 VOC family protein [Yinghuangia sp. ASG 101]
MFTNSKAFSGFAVRDVAAAADFYGRVLGLDVAQDGGLLRLNLPGGAAVLVYPKPDHVPATFTILNFPVDDIDAAVDELTARGVAMLKYDAFPADEKGVSRQSGGPPIAWFTDPSGNVLAVLEVK